MPLYLIEINWNQVTNMSKLLKCGPCLCLYMWKTCTVSGIRGPWHNKAICTNGDNLHGSIDLNYSILCQRSDAHHCLSATSAVGRCPSRFLDCVVFLHGHLHDGLRAEMAEKVELPRHFFRSMRTLSCCSFSSFFFWWYLRQWQWAITVQYWAIQLIHFSQFLGDHSQNVCCKHQPSPHLAPGSGLSGCFDLFLIVYTKDFPDLGRATPQLAKRCKENNAQQIC